MNVRFVELPVGSRGEVIGRLYLSRHIEGSGLGKKDRMALVTAARIVEWVALLMAAG